MTGAEWTLAEGETALIQQLESSLGVSRTMARILVNRGLSNPEQARLFLRGTLADLEPWEKLPGIGPAIDAALSIITRQDRVLVYGDYDVDGLTGTALLSSFLSSLGIKVGYYIPDRLTEGYGVHMDALMEAVAAGFNALITVDCGITANTEIAWAKEQGLTVIVTDHHHPKSELPCADAVVLPRPAQPLAGVGVAFTFLRGLNDRLGRPLQIQSFLDLVCLGTIADVIPLTGDNHILVREGLKLVGSGGRPGLRELVKLCGVRDTGMDVRTLAFTLVPRLNSAGRMGDPEPALRLLMTDDPVEARQLALELDHSNRERQRIESEILEQAREFVAAGVDLEREGVIVLGSPGWHTGVLGIVAGRLVSEYRRPVILLAVEDEEARGSGRSVPEMSLYSLLESCNGLLSQFGGHDMAAGLALPAANLSTLRQELVSRAQWPLPAAGKETLWLDADLRLPEVDERLALELTGLEPYGEGNPAPCLACWGVRVNEARPVGRNNNHLRMVVENGGVRRAAIGFGLGELATDHIPGETPLGPGQLVDVAFLPVLETYQGRTTIKLRLDGVRRAVGVERPLPSSDSVRTVEPKQAKNAAKLTPQDFFPFLKSIGAGMRSQKRNWMLAVPSASLAACMTLWLREMGFSAIRLGNYLRREQVDELARRMEKTAGTVLVATAGFAEQHAHTLSRIVYTVLMHPPVPVSDSKAKRLRPDQEIYLPLSDALVSRGCRKGTAGAEISGELARGQKRLLLYVRRPEQVERAVSWLTAHTNVPAGEIGAYHQNLSLLQKRHALKAWRGGAWRVLIVTPAAAALGWPAASQVVFFYPPFSFTEHMLQVQGAQEVYLGWSMVEEENNERFLASLCPHISLLQTIRSDVFATNTEIPDIMIRTGLAILEELDGNQCGNGATLEEKFVRSWRYREAEQARIQWKQYRNLMSTLS